MRGLILIGLALVALWIVATIVAKVASFAIHLLLLAGIVFLVLAVIRRGRDRIGRSR